MNLMVGWNLEFVEIVVTSAKTRNSSLFSRTFFFSIVRRTRRKKKQRRPERTGGQVACAAVVSFPNAREDRASEWASERA